MASIEAVVGAHNLTMAEVALRWISHHGLMRREHGDAVLIGASSTKHIKQVSKIYESRFVESRNFFQNMIDLEKGPLRAFNLCFVGADN